ncbi:hypothetical protein L5515_002740 [Caenorhabditis briggsae]|uniref:Uncharacterized protein n=2 Tax=Caenorhabditis briggsae TaxID=6238 RepID=A0AAE9E8E3_CAEBR|nr:hypothetical protein L5515_002740 [Caenorhabditis briggsae]
MDTEKRNLVSEKPKSSKSILKTEATYFFILELASAFVLSAAHNVLYFVLDIKLIATSFAQFFFTFLFLRLIHFANYIPQAHIPMKVILPAAGAKLLEVLIASLANSHNRTGELFLVRIFDFLFAGCVLLYFSSRSLSKTDLWLVTPLAVSVSISWLEPGQIEYTGISLIFAFLLPFSRALSFILLKNAAECLGKGHINAFMLDYTRLCSILLFLPALVSYMMSNVEVTASWESIDYVLMSLSFLFMICNLYSQLWLALSLSPSVYLVLENSRNLLASCAQWIIQNMAHPSLIAFGGKLVAFSSIFRIWTRS